MAWMTGPKIHAATDFIQILKDENYVTNEPVQKQKIVARLKIFKSETSVKLNLYQIIHFMLSKHLIKKVKGLDKDYIHFNRDAILKFLRRSSNHFVNKPRKLQNKNLTNTLSVSTNNLNELPSISNLKSSSRLTKSNQNLRNTPIIEKNNINQNIKQINPAPNIKKKPKRIRKRRTFVSQNVTLPSKKQETKYVTKEKCIYCNCNFKNEEEFRNHLKDIAHILRDKYRTNKKSLLNENMDIIFETERNGMKLTEIQSDVNVENIILCKITNKNNNITYEISEIILLYTQLKEVNMNYNVPIILQGNKSSTISVKFSFRFEGTYILPMIFKVLNKNASNQRPMYLLKEIIFYIQSDLVNNLQPTTPYERDNKAAVYLEDLPIIDGVPPPRDSRQGLENVMTLGLYKLPFTMIKLINSGLKMSNHMLPHEQTELLKIRKLLAVSDRTKCLTEENYCAMLNTLLYFEEHQMQKNIRDYDCANQKMRHVPVAPGKTMLLALDVPGLSENRPSLIKGDDLLIRIPGDKCYYKGYIHRVKQTTVELGFFQRFVTETHFNERLYNVTFGFNRHTIRTEHQAVELIKNHDISKFFFPVKAPPKRQLPDIPFVWYQTNIKNNPEQQQAVRHIVAGTSYPAPYLLFGPPGTGKTMTVVETILQLWSRNPKSRILVAAPSNSAANEVTSRLVKHIKSKLDIFRMISASFTYDKVSDDIKPFCNYKDEEYFYPAMEILESYRILIVTLTAAAKFVRGGITPGHFTHIFIDESGHSTESEVLIPIAGIITSPKNRGKLLGQIILAGDPKQLGPIIHSKLAKSFGFGTSMLERLMNNCDVYQKNNNSYNPYMVTKLLKNFRSHEAILKLPDEIFYDKELIPEGNDLVNIAIGWEELPNKEFPLIFHNVRGKDEREENSPSYFNRQEIDVVMKYLKNLINHRLKGRLIQQSDIGIVSPYRKQAQKLQIACKSKRWNDILIGSVEQFQGQERLIIIITTVRSSQELVEHDYKFHLGFLRNPKRFNVAITRAKALVIVIGNPDILMWDKHWGQFIKYCCNNNALAGPTFEFKPLWMDNEDTLNNNNIQNLSLDGEIIANKLSNEHADFSRGNI